MKSDPTHLYQPAGRMGAVTMQTLRLTSRTWLMLSDCAIYPFEEAGRPGPDGLMHVPVDQEIRAAIDRARGPGESDDELILRLIPLWRTARRPDWIETGSILLRLRELNTAATAALIEALRRTREPDDEQARLLGELYPSATL